jgi:hypothetical protein
MLLAVLGIWDSFYANASRRRRIAVSVLLLIALVITVVNTKLADKQHDKDAGEAIALRKAFEDANKTQQQNAVQFTAEQNSSRQQFLGQFNQLRDKVAKLQTEAATEALQKQAADLQAELRTTQEALKPPKAHLIFSLPGIDVHTYNPVLRTSLPGANNVVHVDLVVANPTDVAAEEANISLIVCDICKFAREPPDFIHPLYSPETYRDRQVPIVNAKTISQNLSVDVLIPAGLEGFDVALLYRCKTCIVENQQTVHVRVFRK